MHVTQPHSGNMGFGCSQDARLILPYVYHMVSCKFMPTVSYCIQCMHMISLLQCTILFSQPSHKNITHLLAPFCLEYILGPKPKAMDYKDSVKIMLFNAMHKYAYLILTTNAFSNKVKATQWAKAIWQAACKKVGVQYECSIHMTQLVSPLLYYYKVAGTRNQHGLHKQILPISNFCFFFFTSQKVPYLAQGTGKYDPPLQILCGKSFKIFVQIKERLNYCINTPNVFILPQDLN